MEKVLRLFHPFTKTGLIAVILLAVSRWIPSLIVLYESTILDGSVFLVENYFGQPAIPLGDRR